MGSPKINVRLEHVTRKSERRQKPRRKKIVKVENWTDRLKSEAFCFPDSPEQRAADEAVKQLSQDIEKDLFVPKPLRILGLEEQMPHEDPLVQRVAETYARHTLGLDKQEPPPQLPVLPTPQEVARFEATKVRNATRVQQITIKKLERALAAANMKIADLELEALYKEAP